MELLKEYWSIAAAFFAGVVWFVRLESRARANTAAIRREATARRDMATQWQRQRAEDQKRAEDNRSETRDMLREIRNDLKDLLKRGL